MHRKQTTRVVHWTWFRGQPRSAKTSTQFRAQGKIKLVCRISGHVCQTCSYTRNWTTLASAIKRTAAEQATQERPHAPPESAVRAAVDSSAVLSKHCPNKKLREKNLVKLIGVKWYYRSIVRTAAVWRIFGLNCFEVCRSAGFCFVFFLKKKLVKLSEVHVLQRRFDEFCGFWKLESFEERDDRIDFKCGKLKFSVTGPTHQECNQVRIIMVKKLKVS